MAAVREGKSKAVGKVVGEVGDSQEVSGSPVKFSDLKTNSRMDEPLCTLKCLVASNKWHISHLRKLVTFPNKFSSNPQDWSPRTWPQIH